VSRSELRLGIDLGGTTMSVVLLEGDDPVPRDLADAPTGDHRAPDVVLDRVASLARGLLAGRGVEASELRAAGIGAPGEVEPETGVFRSSPIFPTWREVPVAAALEARLGLPVALDNDANAAAWGEARLGAGRGHDPLLVLTLGTGIGGAVVSGGRVLRGHLGSAGEIGHLSIDPSGPLCWCGGRGCLGLLASASALAARYRAEAGLPEDEDVGGLRVARALESGDPAARRALDALAEALARGIADAICVLAPRRVVLTGGILALGDGLLEPIRHLLARRPYPAAIAACEVVAGALGARAGAVGAALLDKGEPR